MTQNSIISFSWICHSNVKLIFVFAFFTVFFGVCFVIVDLYFFTFCTATFLLIIEKRNPLQGLNSNFIILLNFYIVFLLHQITNFLHFLSFFKIKRIIGVKYVISIIVSKKNYKKFCDSSCEFTFTGFLCQIALIKAQSYISTKEIEINISSSITQMVIHQVGECH